MDKKIVAIIAVVAIVVVAAVAVFAINNNNGGHDEREGVTDAAGNVIKLTEDPKRVATTTNVAAEMMGDLGFINTIVGVTSPKSAYEVSDHIAGIDMKFDYPGDIPSKIDAGTVKIVGSYSSWSVEAVAETNPDLVIIGYDQISTDDSKMKQLQKLGITVVVLKKDFSFIGIIDNYTMMGKILGKQTQAGKITDAMKDAYNTMKDVIKKSDLAGKKFGVISHAGSWGDYAYGHHAIVSLLVDCGMVNVFESDQDNFAISLGEVLPKTNPDILIFEDMGMGLDWSKEIEAWKSDAVIGSVDCIKNDSFFCLEYEPFKSFYYSKQVVNGFSLITAMVNPKDTGVTVPVIVTSDKWTDYIYWLDKY